jgi:hypothetical protein
MYKPEKPKAIPPKKELPKAKSVPATKAVPKHKDNTEKKA